MFDFGEELLIGSYRIPWLIWIQLLVMLLLIVLLYCFGLAALDLADDAPVASTSSGLFPPKASRGDDLVVLSSNAKTTTTTVANCLRNAKSGRQVGENRSVSVRAKIATSTSRRMVREDILDGEGRAFEHCYHPCHYFNLARQAFLKCLGLDSPSDDSSTAEQRKEN